MPNCPGGPLIGQRRAHPRVKHLQPALSCPVLSCAILLFSLLWSGLRCAALRCLLAGCVSSPYLITRPSLFRPSLCLPARTGPPRILRRAKPGNTRSAQGDNGIAYYIDALLPGVTDDVDVFSLFHCPRASSKTSPRAFSTEAWIAPLGSPLRPPLRSRLFGDAIRFVASSWLAPSAMCLVAVSWGPEAQASHSILNPVTKRTTTLYISIIIIIIIITTTTTTTTINQPRNSTCELRIHGAT